MQDFVKVLTDARSAERAEPNGLKAEALGGFEGALVARATRHAFELGVETGRHLAEQELGDHLEHARRTARLFGFDEGVLTLLGPLLEGVSEAVGELGSARAPKVMVVNTKARLLEVVAQLEAVAAMFARREQPGQIVYTQRGVAS